MKTKFRNIKNVVLCVLCLSVVAAASYFSMSAFTRQVFGNEIAWQISFLVLAVTLLLSAAVRRPWFSLLLAVAGAAGMWFYTPYYPAVFFPVALQAALWEGARDETKPGRTCYVLSLLLTPAAIPMHTKLRDHLTYNSWINPSGDAYVCLAFLILLFAFWILLFVWSLLREQRQEKTPDGRRSQKKKNKRAPRNAQKKKKPANLYPAVFAVCALNTAMIGAHMKLLFTADFARTVLFATGIFVFYLVWRKDPTLYALRPLNRK